VNKVSCTFEGTATHPEGDGFSFEKSIVLTSEWHSPHGIYNTETVTWTFGGQRQTKTTSKEAPSGMYLDKPFWCELTWKDADGSHKLVSDTAYCN
jgi:hypothetical protein